MKSLSMASDWTNKQKFALIYAAFIAGLCSIVYELLIATTISYFLGDSVKYFSLTIGIYMAAMGIGSYASKYINRNLLYRFLQFEIILASLGGLCIPLLYLSYLFDELLVPTYVLLTASIGFLIGLEIPFLTRLMESFESLKANIANILSFDYIGALIATVAFPFFLLPFLGTFQSSLVLGIINLTIILVIARYFKDDLGKSKKPIYTQFILVLAFLGLCFIYSKIALNEWDQRLYEDRIVHAEQTRYQKIILTKDRDDIRLFLNGNIQFSSIDEYRYHEALVLYPLAFMQNQVTNVLLLGAGDGLAIKQLLKFDEIQTITLVDLDERIVSLAIENPHLSELNKHSLTDERVTIITNDAFSFIKDNENTYDLIISDLPDPNSLEIARLYSKQFYQELQKNLTPKGVFVTQATSPYFATDAFWVIQNTIEASGFTYTIPYHAQVPSFGEWGFVMASYEAQDTLSDRDIFHDSEFLMSSMLNSMRTFPKDIGPRTVEINTIDRPILMNYYLNGWTAFGY